MTSTKTTGHTPGPWQQTVVPKIAAIFDGASGWHNVMGYSGVQIETEDGYPIALVAPSPTDTEIGSGLRPAALNARLIAAAPDMLALIHRMLNDVRPIGEYWPVWMSDAIVDARALLARVAGETEGKA